MDKDTLEQITNYLSPLLVVHDNHPRVHVSKKVAMTCCYLGSNFPTLQFAHIFGIAEEAFLRVTSEVIDAMVAKIPEVIRWPEENELDLYAAEYNTIGRYVFLVKYFSSKCHSVYTNAILLQFVCYVWRQFIHACRLVGRLV